MDFDLLLQSWAELEEAEGALARAQELRSYRLQEWNQVVLPASFGAMFDAAVLPGSASSSEQPFRAVFDTVSLIVEKYVDSCIRYLLCLCRSTP